MTQDHSELFYLEHESGDRLFPVRILNRTTGRRSFRVSPAGNTKQDHIELDDEADVLRHVTELGFLVRARCPDSGRNGLYSAQGRNIRQLIVVTQDTP